MQVLKQLPIKQDDGIITSLPQVTLDAGRKELLDYFNNGWTLTEVLFSGLAGRDAFYIRPYHYLRHPLIFYYGHVASLYINKLRVAGVLDKPVNAEFEKLFETGVDEMRWDDLHEGKQDIWPSLEEVRLYRGQVYEVIENLIKTHPLLNSPITLESPMWALVMGFEHERIHLETSSVLMRELPIELVQKPKEWPAFHSINTNSLIKNNMIAVPECKVQLGKRVDYLTFGWDNEYGSETRKVAAFSAGKYLITNGEFLEFVKAGGYAEEKYWLGEGWKWRCFCNIKYPTFWVQDGPAGLHKYMLRTIFEIINMQHDWPVCVNFYEAKAYCVWKGSKDNKPYRLLTEAEHNALRDGANHPSNNNLITGAESPVNAFAANSKGLHDVYGNVWQWCEDHFHPLSGAKPHPYYDDFSAPCYDGRHQMILGGSFISTGDEASSFARFHFRPHFFQHAGFRIAYNENGDNSARLINNGAANYETREMLDKYLLLHWGSEEEIWGNVPGPNFAYPEVVYLPLKCAELVKEYAVGFKKALDLGCAVGRSTFEMAKDFREVTGIDYSREFIETANLLKANGEVSYWRKDSGGEGVQLTAKVDSAINRNKVRFMQGDACGLPEDIEGYDAVLLANVLCRLPDPAACLKRMHGENAMVRKGGILVMTTPFSWLGEYTPKANWIDGIAGVQEILTKFELVHQEELPFLIREHRRKFEYIITLASVWRRVE